MSQSNASADQDLFQSLRTQFTYDYMDVAFVALPVYEYLITLGEEVELVWRRKTRFSVPSVLLVSTRVCMVISAVVAVAPAQITCTGLSTLYLLQNIMSIVGFIQIALFSALRVSALYNRNIALFVVVFALGLVPAGTNIFNDTRTIYTQAPGTCTEDSNISDTLIRQLILVSRIPVIAADVLVLILTWAKTYRQMALSSGLGISTPLTTCLTRDGALYFVALLTMNILQIATYRTHLGAPVSLIVPVLPPILINRFMLNLQQACNPTYSVNEDHGAVSTLRFQLSEQVVGSMGASLDHAGSARSDEPGDEALPGDIGVDYHDYQWAEKRESYERSAAGGSAAA